MKKITTWLFATIAGVVLLFAYRTSTQAVGPTVLNLADAQQPVQTNPAPQNTPTRPTTRPPEGSQGEEGGEEGPVPASPGTPQAPPAAGGMRDGTFTGARTNTPYGPVTVEITVQSGAVTAATATEYPTGSRTDRVINNYAIPVLQTEAVGTTDGKLTLISGATYTSMGFVGSLQDAINQAKA